MRFLLVLARLDPERKRTFSAIATASKLELAVSEKVEAALAWLEMHEPRVVVFDTAVVQAEKLCQKIRSKRALASVPLIALVSDSSDAFVEKLYAMGADDVIPASSGAALITRLKALPERSELSAADRGVAVVADRDHGRCDVLGRVLTNAGYDVKYALDDVALRFYTQQQKPRVVVANAELGAPRRFLEDARKASCDAAWIVTASRRDLTKHGEALAGLDRVIVLGVSTPPENVLFMSNELLRGEGSPSRASERVLYGTVVWFKPVGDETDEMGFSYNISPHGLYIRTLAPPEEPSIWLELRPPRCKHRVRLEARLAWRRLYDPGSAASVPPGFGVSLEHGLGDSMQLWRDHCDAFLRSSRSGPAAVAQLLAESLDGRDPTKAPPPRPSAMAGHGPTWPDALVPPRPGTSGPPRVEVGKVEIIVANAPGPTLAAPGDVGPTIPTTQGAPGPRPKLDSSDDALATVVPPSADGQPAEPEPPQPAVTVPAAQAAPVAPPEPVAVPAPAPSEVGVPALAPPRAAERSSASMWIALLVLGAAAAATGYVFFVRPSPPVAPRAAPAPRPSAAGSVPTATAPAPTAVDSGLGARPLPAAGPDAAVPDAGATASADGGAPGASALPPVDESGGGDGSELSWDLGYLVVRSTQKAEVYATGFKVGPTNKKNRSKCGLKFVRLGSGEPPTWSTRGRTVDVKCQAVTTLTLEPGD